MSKNARRVSKSRFNEIFGYETKTSVKKVGAIEKNKFNLKFENKVNTTAIGFNNYYKANSTLITDMEDPYQKQRSTSKGRPRLSLNDYFANPIDLVNIKEFIPKSKRTENNNNNNNINNNVTSIGKYN